MRLHFFLLPIMIISCQTSISKQNAPEQKEKEMNRRKDSLEVATNMINKDKKPIANPAPNEPLANPSKYTGQWIGQGQDMIEINYNNGQYLITLDADNSNQTKKKIIKAKEKNGCLQVDPGICYGYNGMSIMTPVGTKKLVLKSGKNKYTYERAEH